MIQEKFLSFALVGGGWVLWLLVALSVLCLAIAVERFIYGAVSRTPAAALEQAVRAFLQDGGLDRFLEALRNLKGAEARVLSTGAQAAASGGAGSAESAMEGALLFERLHMERGLIVIGTVGNNAPFVGLFGTVLGIIKAFHDLSFQSSEAAASVMAGISEALVCTAVGLMVAIPAVVLYNWFQRRNKERLARIDSIAHLVVARLRQESQAPGDEACAPADPEERSLAQRRAAQG